MGLHAQMHQKQRLKNLERFSANSNGFLIATDVAARGLDIPDVEHVIHYQVPRTSEVSFIRWITLRNIYLSIFFRKSLELHTQKWTYCQSQKRRRQRDVN